MKNPNKINNYKEKAKVLRENGWTDLWHPDNWVKEEWFNHPTIDVDRAGISTNRAYWSIVSFELSRDDLNSMHDYVLEVTFSKGDPKEFDDNKLRELWEYLPRDIKEIGMELGCADKEFEKRFCKFIEQSNN